MKYFYLKKTRAKSQLENQPERAVCVIRSQRGAQHTPYMQTRSSSTLMQKLQVIIAFSVKMLMY